MPDPNLLLNRQYGRPNLAEELLAEMRRAGKDLEAISRLDMVTFEEFHLRGRNATREMAQLAGLQPGDRVLDVGSGVGGPGRTLVDEYGCQVSGVDVAWEFCRAAHILNLRTGLEDQMHICCAQALALPFAAGSFDVAWMQHVSMNIENKAGLLVELRRVVRPGGKLALYEIMAGSKPASYYPLPWADSPELNYLIGAEHFRRMLRARDFAELHWEDITASTIEWGQRALRPSPESPPLLGLDLVIGKDVRQKTSNLLRNLEEDRARLVQVIALRDSKRA